MSRATIRARWTGETFTPIKGELGLAVKAYDVGELYVLDVSCPRSKRSHDHEFAVLEDMWESLPDHLLAEYPSVEHFRKRGLIATGFCDMRHYVCGTSAEAKRWHENLRRELDQYALIQVEGAVIRVFEARSQSHKAMPGGDFQRSKTALLEWAHRLLSEADGQAQERARSVA